MALALDGLRVIDVSQGISGPLCAMQLGDLGAEVIKVEPLEGDFLRRIGPFVKGEGAIFLQLNRNKRSVALNLKTEKGNEVFRLLTKDADVLIEGYTPGTMKRLGLDYESMSQLNPKLIYCSISAYGSRGPMATQPGSELDVQALVGNNRQIGTSNDAPLRIGFDMASTSAAWSAMQAVMAALFWRKRMGEGQKVETSLLSSLMAIWQWNMVSESKPDEWRARPISGYAEPLDYGFKSKDMPFLFNFGRDEEGWRQFCRIIKMEALLDDARFKDQRLRHDNEPALKEVLNPALARWSYEELRRLIQEELGGTVVPMHNAETLFKDPQVEIMEVVTELEHPTVGRYKSLNVPWHFSEPITSVSRRAPPLLGQHTGEILQDLGYLASEILAFEAADVIAGAAAAQ